LGEYLARVKAGEEVVVTEGGRPIARIVPVGSDDEAERLMRLERAGEVRRGSGRIPRRFWEMRRPRDPEGTVRAAVLEEREAGW
jgi:prevent-host-death family protein